MTNSSNVSSAPHGAVRLRALQPTDRSPLEVLLRNTGAFTEQEVRVALELIDEGEAEANDGYRFVVAEESARGVIGYACFGLTPMTDGVFDLYWIAVDPTLQGGGIGRQLLREVERRVQKVGGRWVLIETAGKQAYAATRAFYQRAGYLEIARIPDFYAAGDDKLIYGRRMDRGDL